MAWDAALAAACKNWDLEPGPDSAENMARLMTFAGFNCDGVEGSGGNAILELDILSNRPDCQCMLGLARETAAILQLELKQPSFDLKNYEQGDPVTSLARVRIEDPGLCPRYTARVIRGVKVGPSPQWLQDRLTWMGLQPRNNIVDITNFICFELNQPLHAFDLNTISGREIVVRRATEKEPFTPLYGEIPALTADTLVIADAKEPRAIAGVLGGKGSEVTPESTDILLEAAYFNPANTRRTVRRLKVMEGRGTDSSYRFERGIDLEGVAKASARAARLIAEIAGGTVAPEIIDVSSGTRPLKIIEIRFTELNRVFGADVPPETVRQTLTRLGCRIKAEAPSRLEVEIPSWRRGDLEREIDLIEEVARLYGFNRVPERTSMSARVPARSELEIASQSLRTLFTALGYYETVSDTLVDPKWPAPALWTNQKPLSLDKSSVLREDHSALRNSLLASLLSVRQFNQDKRTGEARLFELGKVFLPPSIPAGTQAMAAPVPVPVEERHVLALVDDRGFQALSDSIWRIGEALGLDGAHLKFIHGVTPDFLLKEQSCRILRVRELPGNEHAEDLLGWMGTISPALQKAFDLRKPLAMCELDLSALANLPRAPRRYAELPAYPEIARDIAMVADENVAWADIESFAASWARHEPLRDRCEPPRFLSVFRGSGSGSGTDKKGQLGAGKKSVAFSVTYRAADRTLTDDEVKVAHDKFQQALLARFNATLRI